MEPTSPINLLNPMTQRRIYANNPFKKNFNSDFHLVAVHLQEKQVRV